MVYLVYLLYTFNFQLLTFNFQLFYVYLRSLLMRRKNKIRFGWLHTGPALYFCQKIFKRAGVLSSYFQNVWTFTGNGMTFENILCCIAMFQELFVIFGRFTDDKNKTGDVMFELFMI